MADTTEDITLLTTLIMVMEEIITTEEYIEIIATIPIQMVAVAMTDVMRTITMELIAEALHLLQVLTTKHLDDIWEIKRLHNSLTKEVLTGNLLREVTQEVRKEVTETAVIQTITTINRELRSVSTETISTIQIPPTTIVGVTEIHSLKHNRMSEVITILRLHQEAIPPLLREVMEVALPVEQELHVAVTNKFLI